jgi:hypothetical protein
MRFCRKFKFKHRDLILDFRFTILDLNSKKHTYLYVTGWYFDLYFTYYGVAFGPGFTLIRLQALATGPVSAAFGLVNRFL